MTPGSLLNSFTQKTRNPVIALEEKRKPNREKFTSAVVVHELYIISLARKGRETAKLRVALMKEGIQIKPVDS